MLLPTRSARKKHFDNRASRPEGFAFHPFLRPPDRAFIIQLKQAGIRWQLGGALPIVGMLLFSLFSRIAFPRCLPTIATPILPTKCLPRVSAHNKTKQSSQQMLTMLQFNRTALRPVRTNNSRITKSSLHPFYESHFELSCETPFSQNGLRNERGGEGGQGPERGD